MNRRNFLLSFACCTLRQGSGWTLRQGSGWTLYGPIVEVPPVTGPRIGILTDTQMSPHILAMFPLMAQRPVDFWLHAGDVADVIYGDDPGHWQGSDDANWQWTIDRLAELAKPVYCVPGNHDLVRQGGNHEAGPADPVLLAKWAQYIGPLRFIVETDYSRFIGFNYLDWSGDNQAWLAAQLDTSKRRVIIQHYPLGGVDPGWYDARGLEKLVFFADKGISLFLTGHRHAFIASREGGSTYVVCPSVFDVVFPNLLDPVPLGLFPMSYPTRGWLELIDSAEGFVIEFYRWDGLKAWVFGA